MHLTVNHNFETNNYLLFLSWIDHRWTSIYISGDTTSQLECYRPHDTCSMSATNIRAVSFWFFLTLLLTVNNCNSNILFLNMLESNFTDILQISLYGHIPCSGVLLDICKVKPTVSEVLEELRAELWLDKTDKVAYWSGIWM